MVVPPDADGARLDRWLKGQGYSFVAAQRLIRTGQVRVDGKRAKPDTRLVAGQEVRLPPLQTSPAPSLTVPPLTRAQQATIEQAILYQDDDLLILNKPFGLAVQGGTGTTQHLDDWLDRWGAARGLNPRLTHRLDRDTSGVLAVALTRDAAARLTSDFRNGHARKTYWALSVGVPSPRQGTIDLPLLKQADPHGGEQVVVDHDRGKRAITDYQVVDSAGTQAAWVELYPRQGRTHQLRVHLAALGCPIQGDRKYGRRASFVQGMEIAPKLHLHARSLTILHPVTGVEKTFIAPLPGHMRETFELFGWSTAP